MKSIVEEVKEGVENAKNALERNDRIQNYEKAILGFEKLVERGLIKKRGHQLLSPTEAHLVAPLSFDTPE